jgi:hypothetical protein
MISLCKVDTILASCARTQLGTTTLERTERTIAPLVKHNVQLGLVKIALRLRELYKHQLTRCTLPLRNKTSRSDSGLLTY